MTQSGLPPLFLFFFSACEGFPTNQRGCPSCHGHRRSGMVSIWPSKRRNATGALCSACLWATGDEQRISSIRVHSGPTRALNELPIAPLWVWFCIGHMLLENRGKLSQHVQAAVSTLSGLSLVKHFELFCTCQRLNAMYFFHFF